MFFFSSINQSVLVVISSGSVDTDRASKAKENNRKYLKKRKEKKREHKKIQFTILSHNKDKRKREQKDQASKRPRQLREPKEKEGIMLTTKENLN